MQFDSHRTLQITTVEMSISFFRTACENIWQVIDQFEGKRIRGWKFQCIETIEPRFDNKDIPSRAISIYVLALPLRSVIYLVHE